MKLLIENLVSRIVDLLEGSLITSFEDNYWIQFFHKGEEIQEMWNQSFQENVSFPDGWENSNPLYRKHIDGVNNLITKKEIIFEVPYLELRDGWIEKWPNLKPAWRAICKADGWTKEGESNPWIT